MSPSVSLLSAVSLAMHSPPPYIHPPPSPHVVSPGNLANSRHKGDERKNISHTHTHTPPYVYSIYSVQTEKEVVEEYRSAHDEDTHQSFCCDEYNSSDCCFATMTLPDFIVLTFLFIVDFLRSLAFFFPRPRFDPFPAIQDPRVTWALSAQTDGDAEVPRAPQVKWVRVMMESWIDCGRERSLERMQHHSTSTT
jgi:hypothetical protein